jgi:hypothetical protein
MKATDHDAIEGRDRQRIRDLGGSAGLSGGLGGEQMGSLARGDSRAPQAFPGRLPMVVLLAAAIF